MQTGSVEATKTVELESCARNRGFELRFAGGARVRPPGHATPARAKMAVPAAFIINLFSKGNDLSFWCAETTWFRPKK